MSYGILTLLPAVLVIMTAIKTKRTTEALLMGVVSSYLIICIADGKNFITTITDSFFSVITDYDTMWLVIVCGLFGSLIALINAANGTHAIARFLGKICKSQKSTLLVAWILGIIIFVDDYMNILTISACTKKLSDERKTPREALAYVIDSTGAPVCVLLPFSTWAIFFAGVFYEQESVKNLGYGNAIQTYIHVIPYIFYAIAALLIVPLFIFGIIPRLGAMKKAYERTELTGAVYSKESEKLNRQEHEEVDINASIWDFLIPIATLIIVQLVTDDMFVALVAAILVCAFMYIPRKKLSGGKFCDLWIQGFADLVPALAIIITALFMRQASEDLMLSEYVIGIIQPLVSAKIFPMIAFITVAGLGFITGSNWGIPAVCAPIIIPLGAALDVNLLLVMAAIVSGGTFCSHACFYSDATVITSSACGIDNMDHVYTQIPYAILALIIACVAFLIAGLVM
ncbi:Na+/H+ antiporter NhaC family protein [Bariatricus sp. SGI.154]|uniref:Na+/H+ antiporter NhaC family protein n=1 Tax=Bariatricus sp. SGI.154 TaxID=3420549 RepID=UPI003D03CADE